MPRQGRNRGYWCSWHIGLAWLDHDRRNSSHGDVGGVDLGYCLRLGLGKLGICSTCQAAKV